MRRGFVILVGVLAIGLIAGPGGSAPQNGAKPPGASSLAGQFLVATDEIRDPRFARTVIYMVNHGPGGAMGLIVNRPVGEVSLAKLLAGLGVEAKGAGGDVRMHYGGPVEMRQGFTLHTADYKGEDTIQVAAGIALSTNPEILRAVGMGTGPKRFLVALGYSGWAPGQLEDEIRRGGWEIVPADEAILFDDRYETKWERAMARRMIVL
jgi:putative transcriptional regulator